VICEADGFWFEWRKSICFQVRALQPVDRVLERSNNDMTTEAIAQKSESGPGINRREFLNLAWLASLGFLTVSLGGVSYLFAMPRFREGEFGGVVTLGTVSEIPPTAEPPANYPKVKLWLSNSEEGVAALYKVCTHLGCLYNWNTQENKFICPCHGSQFTKQGEWIQGPAARSTDRFVVQIVSPEGEVLAETDPETGDPLPLPDNPNAVVRVDTGRKILGRVHD
jgi:cytochrome b6-f complex iron-sulfur subunit